MIKEILINIEAAMVANGCAYEGATHILQAIAEAYYMLERRERIALHQDEEVRSSLMKHLGVERYDANLDEAFKNYLTII